MSVDKVDKRLLGPVLAGFFIMGFCDMVARAASPPNSRPDSRPP